MSLRRIRPAAYAAVAVAVAVVALVPAVLMSAPSQDEAFKVLCIEGGSVSAGGHQVTPPAVCVPVP